MQRLIVLIYLVLAGIPSFSQQFEKPKPDADGFEKVQVKVGGDFAIQLQAIDHEAPVELIDLKNNFNLPTANLNIKASLAPGIALELHISENMSPHPPYSAISSRMAI